MAFELVAEARSEFGKENMKKLRSANRLPGNIYGGSLSEPRAITFDLHETELLIKKNGKSAEYTVTFEGQSYPVRIQEVRYEPIQKRFQHLDLVVKSNG
jgi:large subunit ribosomal protein L25